MNKIRAGVLGATGYAGIELVRLLISHPDVEITYLVSHSYVGQNICEVYPHLTGAINIVCEDLDVEKAAKCCDVVFTALPHGASKEVIPQLYAKGLKVIDLSGDFRYNDVAVYEAWYGDTHPAPELLKESVYGLPELHREDIKKSRLIANPGCYTTCSILAIAPLLDADVIETKNIIVDAKSGVTGAGRGLKLPNLYCECNESFKAYGLTNHRHTSEIEQELSIAANEEITISFTPHLVPMKRGILATSYANLKKSVTNEEILNIYKNFYKNEYFVRIYENGLPEVNRVSGSNFADIGFKIDKRLNRIIVVSCIDNLVKGAAGQAVQNMNIVFGLDETTALGAPGMYL